MRTLILILAAALAFGYHRVGASGSMDGTAWDVRVKPQSFFSRSKKDTLVFDRGTLRLAAGTVSGESSYRVDADGDPAVFTASGAGEDGALSWQGIVKGDRITGTCVRVSGDKVRTYTFQGRRL